jgi:hypothetical protein
MVGNLLDFAASSVTRREIDSPAAEDAVGKEEGLLARCARPQSLGRGKGKGKHRKTGGA